jgi:hypothetical protein
VASPFSALVSSLLIQNGSSAACLHGLGGLVVVSETSRNAPLIVRQSRDVIRGGHRRSGERQGDELHLGHPHHLGQLGRASREPFLRECEVVHTSLLFRLLKSGIAIWSLPRGGKMARQPDSLGFRFALVLALAVIVLALTTWLGTASKWAAPIPASEPVYRAQHLNLF